MSALRTIWAQLGTDERRVLIRVAAERMRWSKRRLVSVDDLDRIEHPEHREFIGLTAERLLMGQSQYGILNIATDKRDWRRQELEERSDGAVYRAIQAIAKEEGYRQ